MSETPEKPPPPAPPPRARSWQDGRAVRRPQDAKKRRLRLALVLGGLVLALAGAITAWVLYLRTPPEPTFRPLVLFEYGDPRRPPPPFADQDRRALSAVHGWQAASTFPSQQRSQLVSELRNLKDVPSNQPLVLYLRAYAVGTPDGGVAL